MKNVKIIFGMLLFSFSLLGQEVDINKKLANLTIENRIDSKGDLYLKGTFDESIIGDHQHAKGKTDESKSRELLNMINGFNPSVSTVRKYLKQASIEFDVPFSLLDAIAKTANNYAMIGPSQNGAYGVMALIENERSNTIKEAANLIGLNSDDLKYNLQNNIRGAAALLSIYAEDNKKSKDLLDWFEAVKKFSGLSSDGTRELQAIDYYKNLNDGVSTNTLWKEKAEIKGIQNNEITNLVNNYNEKIALYGVNQNVIKNRGQSTGVAVDYPGAIAAFSDCANRNFTVVNTPTAILNTYVNHWIGIGTLAGAIDLFQNCSSPGKTSAHFIVAVDGRVFQIVKTKDIANHAFGNNALSIGTEHEVTTSTTGNWNDSRLLKASTDLARFMCNKFSIPKQRISPVPAVIILPKGIAGHNDLFDNPTQCPGNLPFTTWFNLLNGSTSNIPTLTAPAAGANVVAPLNLTWTSSVSGASYRLQISKVNTGWTAANGFTTDASSNANTPVNYSAAGLLSYTWPNPDTATANKPVVGNTYYWTVRSFSTATGTSSYSPVRSFKVTSSTAKFMDNSIETSKELLLYPNPANDILNIELKSEQSLNTQIEILDFEGNILFSEKTSDSKKEINTSNIKAGLYILKVTNKNINHTETIIINHNK